MTILLFCETYLCLHLINKKYCLPSYFSTGIAICVIKVTNYQYILSLCGLAAIDSIFELKHFTISTCLVYGFSCKSLSSFAF